MLTRPAERVHHLKLFRSPFFASAPAATPHFPLNKFTIMANALRFYVSEIMHNNNISLMNLRAFD